MRFPGIGRRPKARCERLCSTILPTPHGHFRTIAYRDNLHGVDHIALIIGNLADLDVVPIRMHSECLTGEAFGSQRCDCGPQLREAMDYVASCGTGAILYLRGHEGRGIGIANKLRAYEQQDHGCDTVSANLALGLPVDARDYSAAAMMLTDLGVSSVELLTNNPDKVAALVASGIRVEHQRCFQPDVSPWNESYLRTKQDVLGHSLNLALGSAS